MKLKIEFIICYVVAIMYCSSLEVRRLPLFSVCFFWVIAWASDSEGNLEAKKRPADRLRIVCVCLESIRHIDARALALKSNANCESQKVQRGSKKLYLHTEQRAIEFEVSHSF